MGSREGEKLQDVLKNDLVFIALFFKERIKVKNESVKKIILFWLKLKRS
jgi:hypothetical protein